MFPSLRHCELISLDTETTGLSPESGDKVFGFSISTEHEDYYWDVRENPESKDWFNDEMSTYSGKIVCHNLSFDYRSCYASGMHFNLYNSYCSVILACLINEHEHSYSLDDLARKYTNVVKKGDQLYQDLAAIFGGRATKNVQMKNIQKAPSSIVSPYAKADSRACYELFKHQLKQIDRQGLHRIVEFERSITPVLLATQMRGVRVNIPVAEKAVGLLSEEISIAQKQLDKAAGFEVNVNSNPHMKQLFKPEWRDGKWWSKDGTPIKSTDGGAASLDAESLREIRDPMADAVLSLRSLIKTRDTFLVGHILESAHNGRVYPSINQCKGEEKGTGTGRLSYSGPALQQIPDRNKKVAQIVKECFLPDEGCKWVDCDMASFEVRMFGHLIGTADIVKAYQDDPETDFHQFVADLTGLVRNATYSGQPNAKQLNLSMIFNQGNGTTAEKMGLPWTWESFVPKNSRDGKEITYQKAGPEAMEIINKYHRRLPGVKKLAEGCKRTAEQRGYIFTRYGRHLRFPNKSLSYKASGLLIQSTSADENKKNWLLIDEVLSQFKGSNILLNTHDSYSLSLMEGEEEKIAREVKKAIEKDRGLRVPLILEVNRPGSNWWESKSSKRWM